MNLKEFLQENNIPTAPEGHDHYRPGWLNFDCPYCSKNWYHYRMGYNLAYGYVNCWHCGGHNLYETLVEILPDADRKEILEVVKGVRDPRARIEVKERGKLILPSNLGPLQDVHKTYLRSRGFEWRKLVKLWGIRGTGLFSESSLGVDLKFRIFIPIHFQGKVVSWTTRSVSNKHERRYLSASYLEEAYDHKHLLYGADYVRHAAIVVEGPTDVWRIGPGAVCTFGSAFSLGQVGKVSAFPVRVICFDEERAAQRRGKEFAELLSVFPGETYVVKLRSHDPGSATDKEIRLLRSRFLGDHDD